MRRIILAVLSGTVVAALALPGPTASRQPLDAGAASSATPPPRSPRNANYTIAVRLDPVTHTLRGRETIVWRNISRAATSELRFHLYYNAWRNAGSTFFREAALAGEPVGELHDADFGRIDVTAVVLPPEIEPGRWA